MLIFFCSLSYLRKAKTKNVRVMECWKYGLSPEKKASYATPNTKSSAQSSSRNQPGKPPEGSQVELPILRVSQREQRVSQMRPPGEEQKRRTPDEGCKHPDNLAEEAEAVL